MLPAVTYSSCPSPLPLPSSISPQSCTAGRCKVFTLKFTRTPNMLNSMFSCSSKAISCKIKHQHKTVHGSRARSFKHRTVLWGAWIFFNKTTCVCHNISVSTMGNTRLEYWSSAFRKLPGAVYHTPLFGSVDPLTSLQTCSTRCSQLLQLLSQMVSTLRIFSLVLCWLEISFWRMSGVFFVFFYNLTNVEVTNLV